jgi:GDPmannose 4,6-dehydratase
MKKALITCVTGQDGSYLAELLLQKGYEVHGIIRRSSSFNTGRIDHIFQDPHEDTRKFILHYGDLNDASNLANILKKVQPDEIYNLGAQSHVQVSFQLPELTANVAATGVLRLLDIVRETDFNPKFYQAGSSEMFGKVLESPQNENTRFYPRSPYACAKVFAHHIAVNYRESYGMFICNGILFNHESPRRGGTFVSKKIIDAFAALKNGKQDRLFLGNIEAKRDWGYAPEYVEGMWRMLQHSVADDYLLATGETHTVREFVVEAAPYFGFEIIWEGEGINEKGIDAKTGKLLVEIDHRYFRPAEVELLLGDASKAQKILGWEPKVKFKELVKIMAESKLSE